jgi:XTP/dITP diphosphohydrolase
LERTGNTILVATNNKNKIPEIVENLDRDGWTYLTLGELGITEAPEETGETYEENARIKAQAPRKQTQLAVLADDSGLEVDALGGAPGVYSSRYAGEDATDRQNLEKLLAELKDVPAEKRTARFVCHIVFIDEQDREISVRGVCEGHIATTPSGHEGFGYDPVFLPSALTDGRTMAQLSSAEKNGISHRGNALRSLRDQLPVILSEAKDPAGLTATSIPTSIPVILSEAKDPAGDLPTTTDVAATPPNTTAPVHIVAFDFDGTVLEGHSPVRLIRELAIRGVIPYRTALKAGLWGLRYKARMKVEQKEPREYLFASFSHLSAKEADEMMSTFYHDDLRKRLRPQALAVLQEHKRRGDVVVFVSASFHPILKEASRDVQVDWFIATQMEIADGVYTGNVEGLPPEGEQKLIQLSVWADETFGKGAWELTAAYGDHYSDEALLAAARQAIAVNPDTTLEKAAKREGWSIVDWSLES